MDVKLRIATSVFNTDSTSKFEVVDAMSRSPFLTVGTFYVIFEKQNATVYENLSVTQCKVWV